MDLSILQFLEQMVVISMLTLDLLLVVILVEYQLKQVQATENKVLGAVLYSTVAYLNMKMVAEILLLLAQA